MLPLRRLAYLSLGAVGAPALAHSERGGPAAPGWTLDPGIIVPLGLLLALYVAGRVRLGRRSRLPRRDGWQFLAGWAVLALALVSPLHEAGEQSFTLHMIEHEAIMLPAAYLLARSRAGGALAWGLPSVLRTALGGGWKSPLVSAWRLLTQPVAATIVQMLVLWGWHAPVLFNRALDQPAWHITQHLSFAVASLSFWVAMLRERGGGQLLSVTCLFLTSLVEGALGALMTFSASPWYAAYARMGVTGIGLDPTADQQLAGLVMWIPGGLLHAGAALALLYRWFAGQASVRPMPDGPITKCP